MAKRRHTDDEFLSAWRVSGGRPVEVARLLKCSVRTVFVHRKAYEQRHGVNLPAAASSHSHRGDAGTDTYGYAPWLIIDGFVGSMVIFSDCHWWPGLSDTPSYRALLAVIRDIKPKIIIGNGDLLDGARISRFKPLGWSPRNPKLPEELEEVRTRMGEIRHAYSRARCIRTIGNHDTRFERWLAERAPEMEGLLGTRLKDHLPAWEETVAINVNHLTTVIKHQWHGGIHAAYNNTLRSGTSFVTGHTHELEAKPFTDYHGTRYGVQTGTLADLKGPQFAYADANPTRGRQGFVVLTFIPGGKMLAPELCAMVDGHMYFRGQRYGK